MSKIVLIGCSPETGERVIRALGENHEGTSVIMINDDPTIDKYLIGAIKSLKEIKMENNTLKIKSVATNIDLSLSKIKRPKKIPRNKRKGYHSRNQY